MSELFQKFCKSHTVFSSFTILVIGLNTLARFPIRIINVVTLEAENAFTVHVSWIRAIIEPFVGFQLFLLRAREPLEEYIALWVWLFLLLGIVLLIKLRMQFL